MALEHKTRPPTQTRPSEHSGAEKRIATALLDGSVTLTEFQPYVDNNAFTCPTTLKDTLQIIRISCGGKVKRMINKCNRKCVA